MPLIRNYFKTSESRGRGSRRDSALTTRRLPPVYPETPGRQGTPAAPAQGQTQRGRFRDGAGRTRPNAPEKVQRNTIVS
jgi:hypothetical protein